MAFQEFKAVYRRELKRMFSRPIYIFGTFGIMLFAMLFFGTLLRDGLPMKMPIGVVDNDHSSLSRRFVREFNSTPGVDVVRLFDSHTEARQEMQRGNIYGFVEISEGLAGNLLSNRRPTISLYTTQSYMAPGTLAYKTFLQMATLASGAVQREYMRAKGVPDYKIMDLVQPIVIDSHLISNPWSNYGVYLVDVILPGILQLVIIIMTIFVIGFELKTRSCNELLEASKGNFAMALVGKLCIYTIIFFVLGFAVLIVLYKVLAYPLQCSFFEMMVNMFLLIVASQAMGLFMIGLFPVLRDALSFGSIYTIVSMSLAGMTFPMEYMWGPLRVIGQFFPLRHYYMNYVHQGLLGGGVETCWIHYLALLLFFVLPLMVMKRLHEAMIYQDYPTK